MINKKLKVQTPSSNYNIYFNNDFEALNEVLIENNLTNKKVCIITDSNVEKIYLNEVFEKIKESSLEIYSYTIKAGEENKNLDTVRNIYEFLVEKYFDRESIIIALGGGVVGDIAGFVASTYMRGISFVQVPTTLLAQVDSGVGGKTGVDFLHSKNMIGSFYQPSAVYVNINTLKTLDSKQFSSGMAEVIKYGLIIDRDYFDYIAQNKKAILNLDFNTLSNIIYLSCKIKANIVSQDEKEKGIRELLNFGHTFGHAIETLSNFTLPHGFCVAVGVLCSAQYSLKENYITQEDYNETKNLFDFFNLKADLSNFNTNEIIKQMYLDKKTKNNILNIVILKSIGKAFSKNFETTEVLEECIEIVLHEK